MTALQNPQHEGRILKVAQLENGYTRIANDLLDGLMLAGLSRLQLLVAMAVIRKTYGYNKKHDEIGLSQLEDLTGIPRNHCGQAVRELVAMNILLRSQGSIANRLGMNTRLAEWKTDAVQPRKRIKPGVPDSGIPPMQDSGTVPESGTVTDSGFRGDGFRLLGVTDSGTTKDNLQKTITKDKGEPTGFAEFWLAYPKKVGRHDALRAFAKIKVNLHPTIMRALTAHKASDQWTRDKGQFIPHAATWLNAKRWEDQVQVAAPSGRSGTAAIINKSLGIREADPFTLEMEGPRLGR